MRSLSVRAKLVWGFGALVAITLLQGGAAYRDLLVIDNAASEIDHEIEERNLADRVKMLSLKEGNAARAFLLTGDEKEIAKYESAKLDYETVVDELGPKLKSEESRRLFGQVKRAGETYSGFADREIQLKREGKQSDAIDVMHTQSVPAFAAFDEAANEFTAHLIKTKQDIDKQQDADVAEAKVIIVIVCVLGVALGVLVTGMISRSVSGAIARIISMIQELAANNLAVEDLEMRDDEIGRAGLALNEMKNNLRSIIQSIATTAKREDAVTTRAPGECRWRGPLSSRLLTALVRLPPRILKSKALGTAGSTHLF